MLVVLKPWLFQTAVYLETGYRPMPTHCGVTSSQRGLGLRETVPAGPTGPPTYPWRGSEVQNRDPAQGLWWPGLWRFEAGTRVLQPSSTNGQEEFSWSTHCCLLLRKEEGSDPMMHGSPLSSSWDPETEKRSFTDVLGTTGCKANGGTKQNNNNKILHQALPRGRERWLTISDEQSPRSLGRPSQGLLHLLLPPGLAGACTGWASCRLYDAA